MLNSLEIYEILKENQSLSDEQARNITKAFMTGWEEQLKVFKDTAASKTDLALLKTDLALLKTDLALVKEQLEATLHKEIAAAFRSMAGLFLSAGIAIVGITLGGVYFLLTHWKP